jgi:dimethylamine monooxygenase subunit A
MLPPETIRLPFEDGQFRMAMALTAAPADEMIELDALYPAEMVERARLLDTRRDEVFAALPGSEAASAEVLARLGELLPRRFPDVFAAEPGAIVNRVTGERWSLRDPPLHPLEVAGRLVQEDLCLLAEGPVLDAAVLCFPSRWRLSEKIGRRLPDVHEGVPLYAERLARPVDRFFAHLQPGRLAARLNWSVVDDPALFQPGGKYRTAPNTAVTADNAGEALFLRVERQTLSRVLDHVLFTIRVHVTPLGRAIRTREDASRLANAVRALPDEMARYKSLPTIGEKLLAWLDARTA